jgi:Mce-associated membrane protein
VSDSTGPVRRRRIAGESGPAAPAPAAKAPLRKPRAKKAAAGKTPVTTTPATAAPVPKAPVAPKTPAVARKAATAKPVVPSTPASSRDEGTSARRTPGSRMARRDLLWLVPATLLALVSLAAGVYLVVQPPDGSGSASRADALDASRRQASSAAASAAETIFTYRYDQLDQHLAASKALMTPAFAKKFESIAPALTALAPQRKIVVKAATREAAALPCGSSCSPKKADVLVFIDQARLVSDTAQPTVFANRIKVSMVKGADGWRVSNIRAI